MSGQRVKCQRVRRHRDVGCIARGSGASMGCYRRRLCAPCTRQASWTPASTSAMPAIWTGPSGSGKHKPCERGGRDRPVRRAATTTRTRRADARVPTRSAPARMRAPGLRDRSSGTSRCSAAQHHTGRRERREGSRPRRGVARHRRFTIPFTRRMGVLRNRMRFSRQENAPTIRDVPPPGARDRLPGPLVKPIAEDIRPARKPWPRTGGQFGFDDLRCDR